MSVGSVSSKRKSPWCLFSLTVIDEPYIRRIKPCSDFMWHSRLQCERGGYHNITQKTGASTIALPPQHQCGHFLVSVGRPPSVRQGKRRPRRAPGGCLHKQVLYLYVRLRFSRRPCWQSLVKMLSAPAMNNLDDRRSTATRIVSLFCILLNICHYFFLGCIIQRWPFSIFSSKCMI